MPSPGQLYAQGLQDHAAGADDPKGTPQLLEPLPGFHEDAQPRRIEELNAF